MPEAKGALVREDQPHLQCGRGKSQTNYRNLKGPLAEHVGPQKESAWRLTRSGIEATRQPIDLKHDHITAG